ncbi:winged helix DNA-binding domain-containing protein [Lentinula aciculospora]|uniref:Winged helix DNA-binding domain-containing protein n=1 Tax=Lentinula aciculospora TaxID=153920 RepID=A0A9W9DQI2_9AGAR|nr:winged helix DNA-binding domain-containing protein [Lentinula aciculospora]
MHRLNGVGLAALDRHTSTTRSYDILSTSLSQTQVTHLQSQLTSFRSALTTFAINHREDILHDPAFRHRFTQMCSSIGVDPLAGPRKGGWWAELLPSVGDWQYELGVQIVDVCVSTRERNGGMIELSELVRLVRKLRGVPDDQDGKGRGTITEEDIIRSVKTLSPLGAGYTIVTLDDGRKMVRSVPKELDEDQAVILALARTPGKYGRVTIDDLVLGREKGGKGWIRERARGALENMSLRDGLCWIDEQDTVHDRVYWVTSAMKWD